MRSVRPLTRRCDHRSPIREKRSRPVRFRVFWARGVVDFVGLPREHCSFASGVTDRRRAVVWRVEHLARSTLRETPRFPRASHRGSGANGSRYGLFVGRCGIGYGAVAIRGIEL